MPSDWLIRNVSTDRQTGRGHRSRYRKWPLGHVTKMTGHVPETVGHALSIYPPARADRLRIDGTPRLNASEHVDQRKIGRCYA